MSMRLMQLAIGLSLSVACCSGHANGVIRRQEGQEENQRQERYEASKAAGIAAVEVGGEATGARRIDLNGATGGWEVFVKIKGQSYGWRVIIDRDTWTVREKQKVQNS